MERIKQAVEKARIHREGQVVPLEAAAAHGGVRPARTVTTPAVAPAALEPKSERSTDADVHYASTQVVLLDEVHLESQRIIAHNKDHQASWAFDLLRTQVLQKMDENGWRTLAVTSPSMESGKTVIAINLAIGIAQQTNRTSLLVDLDLRRPRVASALGFQPKISLNQVLAGTNRLEEALVNPGIPRFVVLPTLKPIANSAEVLGSTKAAELLTEVRDRYTDRIVVIDLPPVLAADDVLALLPRVDCVLLVVGNGVSTQKEIEESMNRLSKNHLLGVVLNKDDVPSSHAYY